MDLLIQFKKHLLQDKTKHSKITVKNYLADIRKFINWFESTFHREFIPGLVTKELAEIYKKQITNPNSQNQVSAARSVKRYLSSLRKFYSFLTVKQLSTVNPFEIELNLNSIEVDSFHLKEFKNYLLLSHASNVTSKNYLMDINQFVEWLKKLPDGKNLDKISVILIEEYKNRLLYEAKFAPISVNRKLSSLRKYFSWLKAERYINLEPIFDQLPSVSNNIEETQNSSVRIQPHTNVARNEFIYSSFPPLRLIQKLSRLGNSTFDLLFLVPVVKILASIKYQWWKTTGRKIFTNPLDELVTQESQLGIKSLPKAFYSPLKISTKDMSLHKKIFYYLRHVRPLWYRKYHSYRFVHYLHFGVLLIYAIFLAFAIYYDLTGPGFQSPVLASLESPPRVLAFSGSLTDASNTPITHEANLRFSLYNDKLASGEALLWQENQIVTPDQAGNFQTFLGQHQGISQSLLSDNPTLFLGITIADEKELSPRQQIATIAYAKDSEKLQGMSPITDLNADTSNVILALDSSGNLTIGGHAAPKFEATGGEFTLSGQTLTLTTGIDSNTNIQISPDGTGIIDAQKPIQNTTNYSTIPGTEGMVQIADSLGIIAESSTQSALLINQNSTGNLISANSNGTAKFTIDYAGNALLAGNMDISGNNLTTSSTTFSLVDRNVINLSIGSDASAISIGATSGATMINNSLSVRGTVILQGAVNANGLISANAGLHVPQSKHITLDGFTPGSVAFIGSNKEISQDNNYFFWDLTNKRLGLGTTAPSFRLGVQDDQATTVVSQIYNSNVGTDADGLSVKLGNSSGTVDTTNHFINFETAGAGLVGSIQGNGSNGIQIMQMATADWAEYIQKDPNETIPFGSLVCIKENGNATSCDEFENKIVGIASEHPTIIAGENKGAGSIAVGLTGLVKTFVSTENGNIKPGDLITYSQIPGIGVKAIEKGMVVGRSLEGYENSNASQIGTVLITLQNSWYDPEIELSKNGEVNPETAPNTMEQSFSQGLISSIFDNITTGLIETKKISTEQLSVATDNITIGGQTIKEYIEEIVNKAIDAKSQELLAALPKTEITPSPTLTVQISPTPEISPTIQIASDSAVASSSANNITNITNIYNSISTTSASQEEQMTNIASSSAVASLSANLYPSANSTSGFPSFEQGFLALGASSLTDVSISGILHVGESTTLSENTINTIGTNLELQPLRQGNLSIMGELVTIDTEGNLNVNGNAAFAKDVEIKGTLTANIIAPVPDSDLIINLKSKNRSKLAIHGENDKEALSINNLGDLIASGSGTFKNLNIQGLNIIRGAQADTSFTETIASGSAGTAIITAYETERTIKTPFVKGQSLIYITATSDTQGVSPYVARQVAESKNIKGSFTIQIPRSITKDIKLNWWIIN